MADGGRGLVYVMPGNGFQRSRSGTRRKVGEVSTLRVQSLGLAVHGGIGRLIDWVGAWVD